jgi:hypothetical protein
MSRTERLAPGQRPRLENADQPEHKEAITNEQLVEAAAEWLHRKGRLPDGTLVGCRLEVSTTGAVFTGWVKQ